MKMKRDELRVSSEVNRERERKKFYHIECSFKAFLSRFDLIATREISDFYSYDSSIVTEINPFGIHDEKSKRRRES